MKIGNKIIHLNSVDSTNNYIANLNKSNEIDSGTVILADEQFNGRGQRGSGWSANPGENLTFSFFLDNVNLAVDKQFFLTELVSLVLIDLLHKNGVDAKIKWPNDIYVEGKKISGMLIENQLSHSGIKSTIIGVGLNINQQNFEGFKATSLIIETGQFRQMNDVLFSFVESFNRLSSIFSPQRFDEIHNEYLSKMYLFKEESKFSDEKEVFNGEIVNVLNTGQLVVKREEVENEYNLKEIKFL